MGRTKNKRFTVAAVPGHGDAEKKSKIKGQKAKGKDKFGFYSRFLIFAYLSLLLRSLRALR
jgi:hypothetical protein